MQSTKDHVISISYQLLTEPNGPIADQATAEQPFSFLLGHGNVLPKFEAALTGVSVGDSFEFVLTPTEGYGEIDPEALVALDINMFTNEDGAIAHEMLVVGAVLPLRDNQGNQYRALIKNVDNEHVHVDLNHPMAGKTLYFSGNVIAIREATAEELSHGHVHDGTHHH
jgi:FKBP-type peptidyl-prolyl cis-trans isomerase SlyD